MGPPVTGATFSPLARSPAIRAQVPAVRLDDARALSVPLPWYPRLPEPTAAERENHDLIGNGEGIHRPELDEDVSVESLLAGRPSAESAASLARWRQRRR